MVSGMTVKLTVVYGKPDDTDTFEKHYNDVHMPIVQRFPGLQRTEISRVSGGPMGSPSPYHWIAELYFADEAALNEALGSASRAGHLPPRGWARRRVPSQVRTSARSPRPARS